MLELAPATIERHYTIAEVAAMWNLSKDAVRRIFQNEPGVLILPARTKGNKRRYTTLRIPQRVLERVHRRCSLVT
jgi:transcriptional regulator GlxA family with amidase domain